MILMSTHNNWGDPNEYPQHMFEAILMSTHNIYINIGCGYSLESPHPGTH